MMMDHRALGPASRKETIVNTIYRLAKAKDRVLVWQMIKAADKGLGIMSTTHRGYSAVMLLAKEGDEESVEFLTNTCGLGRNDAIEGYAWGGHIDKVNKLMEFLIWARLDAAVRGYERGGFLKPENILYVVTLTNDEKLRDLLLKEAKEKTIALDTVSLLAKANKLSQIISNYGLNYPQAHGLLEQEPNIRFFWLFQAPQFSVGKDINNNAVNPSLPLLPEEIYFQISSLVYNLPIRTMEKIFFAVHKKIFSGIAENYLGQFKSGFFAPEEYLNHANKSAEAYVRRISFTAGD